MNLVCRYSKHQPLGATCRAARSSRDRLCSTLVHHLFSLGSSATTPLRPHLRINEFWSAILKLTTGSTRLQRPQSSDRRVMSSRHITTKSWDQWARNLWRHPSSSGWTLAVSRSVRQPRTLLSDSSVHLVLVLRRVWRISWCVQLTMQSNIDLPLRRKSKRGLPWKWRQKTTQRRKSRLRQGKVTLSMVAIRQRRALRLRRELWSARLPIALTPFLQNPSRVSVKARSSISYSRPQSTKLF